MAGTEDMSLPGVTAAPSRGAALLRRGLSTLVLLPLFLWLVMAGPLWLFGAIIVLLGALTAALWQQRLGQMEWQPAVVTVFGILYVNWLLGYAFWLRDLESGKEWVLLLVWVTWLGETAAYLVGSAAGRHRLAPMVSPKKTVEGAVAQLVVSVLAAVIAQMWFFPALGLAGAALVGLALGVSGQIGDLVESALKRSVGTKDTGSIIPGHGGVLDRIDSLLFNTPVLFYCAAHMRGLQ